MSVGVGLGGVAVCVGINVGSGVKVEGGVTCLKVAVGKGDDKTWLAVGVDSIIGREDIAGARLAGCDAQEERMMIMMTLVIIMGLDLMDWLIET